ncbi:MAG: sugar transferase [Bacteroidales bacterium]|jgi:exopolysaccharide biosynthesis polyprenyl glycosylphosphotransferase|nr:sugar transferase [Bacteroidales bacterium]
MIPKKFHAALYVGIDFISAALAWLLFFIHRKSLEVGSFSDAFNVVWSDGRLYQGLVIVPLGWLLLYSAYGYYRRIFTKTLFSDVVKTLNHSIGGVIVLFFIVILDDYVESYDWYYHYVFVLFILHFGFTLFGRMLHTYLIRRAIRKGKILFNTILIGNGTNAQKIYAELQNQTRSDGYNILGYVRCGTNDLMVGMPCFGEVNDLETIVKSNQIEDVIIALNDDETSAISGILSNLVSCKVSIHISPNLEPFLHKKVTSFLHTTLLLLNDDPLPAWQSFFKRAADIVLSFLFGVLLIPLILVVIWKVKRSSKGSVFYKQERIGLYEKPFLMYKFRSMYQNAETPNQPMLSSETDERVTPFGRFMRKYRIDELPQLWNVLKGDMSLVGPRPERQYFIDQIVKISPQYKLLLRVKPGITSWGEVKYGYASSVDQMIERMAFDLQYIDNMSLSNDLKILIYTVATVLRGEGK